MVKQDVPSARVGSTAQSKRASISQDSANFTLLQTLPKAQGLYQGVNHHLVPDPAHRFELAASPKTFSVLMYPLKSKGRAAWQSLQTPSLTMRRQLWRVRGKPEG